MTALANRNSLPQPAEDEDAALLEAVVVGGDLAKLSAADRVRWYVSRCRICGLDPRAQPFAYISLQGKLTLYATKGATDQLAANRNLCVEVLSREVTDGDIYEVVCRVRDASGRVTEDLGAVFVGHAQGEALANLRMKATTKAKRRAILSHCGLGMLDETEAESIPGMARTRVSESGELLGALPEPAAPIHDLAYWRRYAMALYAELGGDPKDKDACRADIAKDLGIDAKSRRELTAEEWEKWAGKLRGKRDVMNQAIAAAAAEDGEDPEENPFEEGAGNVALDAMKKAEHGAYAQQTGL